MCNIPLKLGLIPLKRIALLLTILAIVYLSNTPHLTVENPHTWINPPQYKAGVSIKTLLQPQSEFYLPYGDIYEKVYGGNSAEFLLHKLGHVVFYSLLALLLAMNLHRSKLMIWFLATLFAFTDEIHQMFVVGRDGRLVDVLLDSWAVLLTLLLLHVIRRIWLDFTKQKKESADS
jgi:VanZ family protein